MAIFLDTGFFIALYNTLDENHKRAQECANYLLKNTYGKAFTSNYVLDEAVAFSLRKLSTEHALKIEKNIQDSKLVDMLFVDDAIFAEAKLNFKKFSGLGLTITDWTNIVLMSLNKIDKILSFDSGFDKIKNIKEFKKIERIH